MSSLDLVADEAKHQSAAACNENASLSPRVALRKDLSTVVASMTTMKRSWSADSLSSTGVKTCVCAPTTHPGSFRCRLHRQTALRHAAHAQANSVNALAPPPGALAPQGPPTRSDLEG